jgi:hypothetical protein
VFDIRMTFLRHVLDSSNWCPKIIIFRHFLDRCPTPVKYSYNTCQTSVSKDFFFASTLLRHKLDTCPQRLKMSRNNDIDQ